MSNFPNNGVLAEIFAKEIKDKLYASNAFLNVFTNTSEWVNGRTVHIPNFNSSASIIIDGNNESTGSAYDYGFNADGVNDEDLEMTLKAFETTPLKVQNIEELTTSYPKFQAVVRNTVSQLTEKFGTHQLYNVGVSVSSGRTYATTGALSASTGPNSSTRRVIQYQDIVNIAKNMDLDDLPAEDRYIVMHPEMYYELLNDKNVTNAEKFGDGAPLPTGVIKRIANINIMTRSSVLVSSGTPGSNFALYAPKDYTSTFSGNSYCSLAFHAPSVAFASTEVDVYSQERDVYKKADIVSAMIYGAAKLARTDSKGAYILYQATA